MPQREEIAMATLKANGGAVRFYEHPANGSRIAVCANGRVLINPGGKSSWKRSRIQKDEIEARGFRPAKEDAKC
jgi:hypothetical protein